VCACFVLYSERVDDKEGLRSALVETAADLASIAMERANSEAIREENEHRLRFAIEGAGVGTWE
jgi:hypothetical protein